MNTAESLGIATLVLMGPFNDDIELSRDISVALYSTPSITREKSSLTCEVNMEAMNCSGSGSNYSNCDGVNSLCQPGVAAFSSTCSLLTPRPN